MIGEFRFQSEIGFQTERTKKDCGVDVVGCAVRECKEKDPVPVQEKTSVEIKIISSNTNPRPRFPVSRVSAVSLSSNPPIIRDIVE